MIQLFIQFLLATFLIPLVIASVGNVLAGTAKSVNDKTFKWSIAFDGVKSLVMLAIAYLTLGAFAFSVKDVAVLDIQVFSGLFAFLTLIVIVTKGNSLAMHFIELAKIPVPDVMKTFDERLKKLLTNAKPDFLGLTEDEV